MSRYEGNDITVGWAMTSSNLCVLCDNSEVVLFFVLGYVMLFGSLGVGSWF